MIFDSILNVVKSFLLSLLSIFPPVDTIQVPNWGPYLSAANCFVDMPLLMSLVAFFLAYEAVVIGIRVILWVRHTILP